MRFDFLIKRPEIYTGQKKASLKIDAGHTECWHVGGSK